MGRMKIMKKPQSSRFFQRPATKTGWWAGGLAIIAMLMLAMNNLGLNPFAQITTFDPSFLVTAYDLTMFSCLIGSIVLGVIALTGKRERSWMVCLFMVPVLVLVVAVTFLLFERMTYSGRVEAVPTPDANIDRMAVIYDDDGSPDGTSALLFLLSEPRAEVKAVSLSYGEAHPQVYIQHLGWMLERYGYGDMPLGAGQDAPLAGDNRFPDPVREASNGFWGFAPASADQTYPVQDSAELMVKTIRQSGEPVTLFVSGALTNLAQALQMETGIRENIAAVFIMGGAVYVPGNLNDLLSDTENTVAEWNIYADPQAASEVFASGLNLYLVPLDATNQVHLTRQDIGVWRKGGSIPDFAADIYDSLMGAWGEDEIEIWDLMTAEIMMNPGHCTSTPLRLEVVTAEGNTQGQTRVVEGDANVNVCLEPDGEAIKQMLGEVFSSRK